MDRRIPKFSLPLANLKLAAFITEKKHATGFHPIRTLQQRIPVRQLPPSELQCGKLYENNNCFYNLYIPFICSCPFNFIPHSFFHIQIHVYLELQGHNFCPLIFQFNEFCMIFWHQRFFSISYFIIVSHYSENF